MNIPANSGAAELLSASEEKYVPFKLSKLEVDALQVPQNTLLQVESFCSLRWFLLLLFYLRKLCSLTIYFSWQTLN